MKTSRIAVAVSGALLLAAATGGCSSVTQSASASTVTGPASASTSTGPAVWPTAGAPAPTAPKITWRACKQAKTPGLLCATVPVPLSYREPNGPKILLDVAKLPASNRKARKGSVFVNPGGPGESAIAHAARFKEVLGTPITSTFDIIAMDPRGVGPTDQARCWSTSPEPQLLDTAPSGAAERKIWAAHDAFENKACSTSGKPIIDHLSTGNVARDMDLVRQAVGDQKLTYYGVSYGTVLGATYAAMFPNNVRAVILDGVVDPVAWTTGRDGNAATVPVSARNGSQDAANDNLMATIAACEKAGAAKCPYAKTVRTEWAAVVAELRKGPVELDGSPTSLAMLTYSMENLQYDPDDAKPLLGLVHDSYLSVVKKQTDVAPPPPAKTGPKFGWAAEDTATPTTSSTATPTAGATATDGLVPATQPQPEDVRYWDTFTMQGPMCSDSVNPTDPEAWGRYADSEAAKSSPYTEAWLWNSSLCAGWPGKDLDAYRGPFDVPTAVPVLVVGNTHDNATPLSNAQTVAKLIPGARLLTVDAFGHTAADKSACASKAMRAYLLDGTLPAEGTVCTADKPLF